MFRSVRLRLIGYVVGVLALVLLAVGALVYTLLTRQLDGVVDAELRAATSRIAALGGPWSPAASLGGDAAGDAVFTVRLLSESVPISRGRGARSIAASADGWREVARGGPAPDGLPLSAALDAAEPGRDDLRTVSPDGASYRLLTRVVGVEGRFLAATQVGVSLAERDRQERIVLLALGGGGALGLALTLTGGFFLTGRALAPVRLAFERQRRFVGDASHELRTPLALLRLEVEDLSGQLEAGPRARPLLSQVDRLSRLVESLLSLARLDEGAAPLEKEPLHLASLLRTAAMQAEQLAAENVSVSCAAPEDLWIAADPDQLHQVLLILVDNAARATPVAGRITLSAAHDGGFALITVADTGPGIPGEHRERVFDRFYRVDRARARKSGGAGLGLAIAREIVRAHGGEIWLPSPVTQGTRVLVRLEAIAAPTPAPFQG